MGPTAGMEFVESRADLDAIVITKDDEILVSSGLKKAFRRLGDEQANPAP
jgi:thiamine biosynthesis lipoprotein ApbE